MLIRVDTISRNPLKRMRAGIRALASFIIGFPGETREDIKRTVAFARRLEPDYVQFSFATPYPGTELYRSAKRKGLLLTEDWSQCTAGKPIIGIDGCSEEELMRLLLKAYRGFYLYPKILLRHLRRGHFSSSSRLLNQSFDSASDVSENRSLAGCELRRYEEGEYSETMIPE
ncbi:TPA: hypothetical protein EYP44_03105 [Candidatus Bathyarchaeota archaeon]|nr:hypothetical protein [Candidatus Bathyarchaeota archaeon]